MSTDIEPQIDTDGHRGGVPKLRFPEFRDAGAWGKKKIGEVLIAKSRPFTMKDKQDYSLVTVKRRYGGVVSRGIFKGESIKVKSQFLLKENDFLISKRQIVHCACGLVPEYLEGSIVSNEYSVLTARKNLDILFFNYFSQQFKVSQSFLECSVGIVIEKMLFKLPDWLKREFLFPSLKEQQKIADFLTSLDELIIAQAKKLDTLKAHKKGLMQQLFPAEGETVPKLRFPEFLNAGAWKEKQIEELAKRGSGHTPNKKKPSYYNGGIKWVSLADSNKLDNRYIYETKTEISKEGLSNSSATLHPCGTVIVSRDAGVGKSAILHSEMAVSQHFIAWVCDQSMLSNWFLYYLLQTLKPTFERIAVGNTIKTIGLPFFKELCVPIPFLPEQQKIADCLISLDELITAQAQKLDTLKAHKKGLMQQLFPATDEVYK